MQPFIPRALSAAVLALALAAADGSAQEATPGDPLTQMETELSASAEARACAAGAQATGTVEYELRVDASGITFRTAGNLPRAVLDCLDGVLNDIMNGITVPPDAQAATRRVALQL